MIEIQQFVSSAGINYFEAWFSRLDHFAAAKISVAIYRLQQGHSSNVKNLGEGIFEYKIYFGPGYRIYFGKQHEKLILLLGGGTKKAQSKDIALAKLRWNKFKQENKTRT